MGHSTGLSEGRQLPVVLGGGRGGAGGEEVGGGDDGGGGCCIKFVCGDKFVVWLIEVVGLMQFVGCNKVCRWS